MWTTDEILVRIAHLLGTNSDAEMARSLGVAKSTLANWRYRNSIPWELCWKLAEERGVSLDWLLLGRGQPQWVPPTVQEVFTEMGRGTVMPVHISDETERTLAGVSAHEKLWRILKELERESSDSTILAEATGIPLTMVNGYLLLMERKGMVQQLEGKWELLENGNAVLLSRDHADSAAHGIQVVDLLLKRILPEAESDGQAAYAIAEIRVKGPTPGERVMQAMRAALIGLDSSDGDRLAVVVGVARDK